MAAAAQRVAAVRARAASAGPPAMQCCPWRGWVVQRAGGLWQGRVKLIDVKPRVWPPRLSGASCEAGAALLLCRHPRVAHRPRAFGAPQRAARARSREPRSSRAAPRGRAEIEGMMAIVVRGDAMSPDDVAKAFAQIEQVDAVVSTIGGTPADPNADSQARPRAGAPRSLVPASRRAHAPTATGCAASPNGARSSKCAAGHTYAARAFCGLPRPAGVRGRLGSCTMHAGASRAAAHINHQCMPVDAPHPAHSPGPDAGAAARRAT